MLKIRKLQIYQKIKFFILAKSLKKRKKRFKKLRPKSINSKKLFNRK